MKATFGHQTKAPTELINDNTVTLSNKLIFLYLKTRRCKYYALTIVYMKRHKLSWIRILRNLRKFDLHEK